MEFNKNTKLFNKFNKDHLRGERNTCTLPYERNWEEDLVIRPIYKTKPMTGLLKHAEEDDSKWIDVVELRECHPENVIFTVNKRRRVLIVTRPFCGEKIFCDKEEKLCRPMHVDDEELIRTIPLPVNIDLGRLKIYVTPHHLVILKAPRINFEGEIFPRLCFPTHRDYSTRHFPKVNAYRCPQVEDQDIYGCQGDHWIKEMQDKTHKRIPPPKDIAEKFPFTTEYFTTEGVHIKPLVMEDHLLLKINLHNFIVKDLYVVLHKEKRVLVVDGYKTEVEKTTRLMERYECRLPEWLDVDFIDCKRVKEDLILVKIPTVRHRNTFEINNIDVEVKKKIVKRIVY